MDSSIIWIGIIILLIIFALIVYVIIRLLRPTPPPTPPSVQLYNIQSAFTQGYLTVVVNSDGTNFVNCNGLITDPTSTWGISPTNPGNVILINTNIGGSLTWGTIVPAGVLVSVSSSLNPGQSLVQQTDASGITTFLNAQNTADGLTVSDTTSGGQGLFMAPVNDFGGFILIPK